LIAHTLETSSERERSLLCLSLGVLGSALASQPLVALLASSGSEQVRMASAWALIHVGSVSALEGLVSQLTDPSEHLVRLACVAVARITAEQVIRPLTSLLDHDSWRIRLQSAVALMHLSVKETKILSTLTDLASSPDAATYDSMVDDLELIEMMFPVLKGDNEPKSRLKINDLIEEARRLVG
jgi:HEAT repeat protein